MKPEIFKITNFFVILLKGKKAEKAADVDTKQFFLQLTTSGEQVKLINNKINSSSHLATNDKLREGSHLIEDNG